MIDQWRTRWDFPSSSGNGKMYVVARKDDGSFGCDCPSWKFARAPKQDCKHILEVKSGLADELPIQTSPTATPKRKPKSQTEAPNRKRSICLTDDAFYGNRSKK